MSQGGPAERSKPERADRLSELERKARPPAEKMVNANIYWQRGFAKRKLTRTVHRIGTGPLQRGSCIATRRRVGIGRCI
jgi:hypothetical protein